MVGGEEVHGNGASEGIGGNEADAGKELKEAKMVAAGDVDGGFFLCRREGRGGWGKGR